MMRALVVHSGNMYGGVERVLDTLAQARRFTAAVEPTFALCFDAVPAASLRRHGAAPIILGPVRITRPDLVLRARRRFAAVLRQVRPDVVITPSVWTNAVFAPAVRRERIPLVQWVHDELTGATLLERLAARHQPDRLVCNSRFSLAAARSIFPTAPADVVYCPLAFDDGPLRPRAEVRRELNTPDDAVVVVNVARMEPLKGQRLLIESLARLQDNRSWACWIAGGAQRPHERQYEQALLDLVASLGLADRVRFLGHRSDVPSLLHAADLYCHPNTGADTFGLSIVEAMHAGLPVIATAIGGPAEVVNERCGRLVPVGSSDALAEAIDSALRDDGWRRRAGAAGPSRASDLCDPAARLADFAAALGQVRLKVAA